MTDNKKPSINLNGAEIKRLAEDALKSLEPFEVRDIVARMQETINRQQAEIERLEKQLNSKYKWENMLDKKIKEVKAEAIKEFAERLKGNAFDIYTRDEYIKLVAVHRIDNLVKEMVGDAE